MTQQEALTILKTGKNVFLTGEPGAGKTYTINQFVAWCRGQNKRVAITASTGIAATHIDGVTIHSWSGIGIKRKLTDDEIEHLLENNTFKLYEIKAVDVLIIDEISMVDAVFLDLLDRVMRRARNVLSDLPFGGVQIVFVGDFFQLPPVPSRGEKTRVRFSFESDAWKDATPYTCYITEQHRQEDPIFLEILTNMRKGTLSQEHISVLESRYLPVPISETTMLYTHNAEVDRENDLELAKLPGIERGYTMTSSGHEVAVAILKKQCLSPDLLLLKVGALVMFTRNNWDTGYVNGTIGMVTEFFSDGTPVVATKDGKQIVVLQAEWKFVDKYGSTTASIKQLPLRLAWAMTVHKSQGMSLDQAHIDLSKTFEFGQGYVALSRVRSLQGLTLEGFNKKALQMHPAIVKQDKVFRGENI